MKKRVVIRHAAGYVGRELIRLVLKHPRLELVRVTSRSQDGKSIGDVHPEMRGMTDLKFSSSYDLDDSDCVFVAAEHGKSMTVIRDIVGSGYDGKIIDMSADFRLDEVSTYEKVYRLDHESPELLDSFVYGLSEVNSEEIRASSRIGNPGCYATAISLALYPLAKAFGKLDPSITAMTGSSGSGALASSTTHFSTRDGNVRSYKELEHRHQAEVNQVLGNGNDIRFVPSSGPWVRGIWGNAQLSFEGQNIESLFQEAYGSSPLIRLHPNQLPELRWAANSPFADIGWIVRDNKLVIGFALDNMLKGAASQAVQNLNLMMGLDETEGLINS